MAPDSGYDDHKLYKFSTDKGFELICPVSEIYNHTSSDRLELINFYDSELGQAIYSWRSTSVEPLIEHQRCLQNRSFTGKRMPEGTKVLLSVLIYQIMVYYNCITGNKQPKAIKHMLGTNQTEN